MSSFGDYEIRLARPSDLYALYAVCLETGDNGEDATTLYTDPCLLGHVYVGPYAVLEPDLAFVVEDGDGVAGYVLGAANTALFEERLEREWWPALRRQYAEPTGSDPATWSPDQRLAAQIHHPDRTPPSAAARYPAHLHLDLLPRMRGKGAAAALLQRCFGQMRHAGVHAVMLGASRANHRGVKFWEKSGFAEIVSPDLEPGETIWTGREI
ncbi:MAG: GNAT family N-acetyltransferase [Rhizobiaceae bacterium]